MRVLVVQPKRPEREALLSLLSEERYEVVGVADAASALQALEARPVDVAIVEHVLPGMAGHELVRRIRAQEGTHHTWIVVTNALGTAGCIRAAFAAGADDFLCGRGRDEVLGRVEGLRRVGAWAKTAFARSEEPTRPDHMLAWRSATEAFTAALGDMVGLELRSAPPSCERGSEIAVLPVTFATAGYLVKVRVAFAANGAEKVSQLLLGQASTSSSERADILREIANLMGGAWKRLALGEGDVYSLGIPEDASTWTGRSCVARLDWMATSADQPLVHLGLELIQRSNELVVSTALQEGMVLVHDVHNQAGAMLLRGGTRLTRSHLGHIERALGCKALVEVALAT